MSTITYPDFIAAKSQASRHDGFEPLWLPGRMKPFQRHLTEWAIRRGRGELMEDCGLGKTYQELVFAENAAQKTGKPSLVVTPLAVAAQTVREGEKFDIGCVQSRDGAVPDRIVVTNYEKLHLFDADDFGAVIPDEASTIKAFDGKRRKLVTRFLSHVPYRLLATATPAPNDYIELGTAAEALGEMSQSEMLSAFFRSSDNMRHSLFKDGDFWNRAKWFLKPHAEVPFWRWVCSWSRACRTPSDIGFSDDGYVLPPLVINQHTVDCDYVPPGELFVRVARTLREQREERRRSMAERCAMVASLVDHGEPAIAWCQYNEEGDMLARMIPGAVQVAGRNTDDEKEDRLNGFALGRFRVLVTKPGIAAWGMNYQHCGHHTFFPSHSAEQFYQCIRRSLRFGRVGAVHADIVATRGEAGVTANLTKKLRKSDEMFAQLIAHMNEAIGVAATEPHANEMEVPQWL